MTSLQPALIMQPVPTVRNSIRRLVREATRSDHQRIDQTMSNLDFASRVDYGKFLNIQYTALSAIAGRSREQDQPDFLGFLLSLVDDLQTLDCPVSPAAVSIRTAKAHSLRQWGIAYVIRGSRLGGAILRKRVPATYPTAFLDFVPDLAWPDFLKQLDELRLTNSQAQSQIIRGAKQGFEAFAAAAAGAGLHHE